MSPTSHVGERRRMPDYNETEQCTECGGLLVENRELRNGFHKWCTDFTTEDYLDAEDMNDESE